MNASGCVVITGAGSGLGRELAIRYAQNDYRTILNGRCRDHLDETAEMCFDSTIITGSLADDRIIYLIGQQARMHKATDLVCCAGQYLRGDIIQDTYGHPKAIIDTNVIGTINLIRELAHKLMGTIVNINSVAGKNIAPNEAIYSASKHALTGFFKSFRLEAAVRGIRVLDVFLGAMQTRMMAHREDYAKLINPKEAAAAIFQAATTTYKSLQVEELTIGRWQE
jgi:short-subunit dehydrogenase